MVTKRELKQRIEDLEEALEEARDQINEALGLEDVDENENQDKK